MQSHQTIPVAGNSNYAPALNGLDLDFSGPNRSTTLHAQVVFPFDRETWPMPIALFRGIWIALAYSIFSCTIAPSRYPSHKVHLPILC